MKLKRIITAVLSLCLLSGSVTVVAENADTAKSELKGEGMCIAVLAEGFFLEHESFALTTDTKKLTRDKSDKLFESTKARSLLYPTTPSAYVNDKIPFAFDYGDGDMNVFDKNRSDIGTAVISIAAGNDAGLEAANPAARGVAPEAQVLAMKVYCTDRSIVTAEAMTAAIEDSVILGADVILITEQLIKGSVEYGYMKDMESALIEAENAGVAVICAAGDIMPIGTSGIYDEHQFSMPTSAPDVGNVAYPASSEHTFAVGNAVSNEIVTPSFLLDNSITIPFSDSNHLYETATSYKSFNEFFSGQTLFCKYVSGIGKPEDYAPYPSSMKGKIAVVNRGEISFSEKAKNAAAAGAVGIIIVDTQTNEAESLKLKMDLTDAPIPAIFVSTVSGRYFSLASTPRMITVTDEPAITVTRKTPSVSSTSARGTSPALSLKPDICSVSTAIECALADGTYGIVESSAAAAANVTGMYALVCQKLSSKFCGKQLMQRTYAILVSSASLMEADKWLYSPRMQGGGFADSGKALGASLMLTSNGSHKIGLGDNNGQILQFKLTASNISDEDKLCTLDGTVGSDGYTVYSVSELDSEAKQGNKPFSEIFGADKNGEAAFISDFTEFSDARIMIGTTSYQLNKSRADYSPYTFTLKSGESMSFDVSVYIDTPTYQRYCKCFSNGFFAEGFMCLTSGDETASIPFLGYCGSFSSASAIDGDIYENELSVYGGVYLYRLVSSDNPLNDGEVILGMSHRSNVTEETTIDKNTIAFSPDLYDGSDSIFLSLSLLRTVTDVKIEIADSDGNILSHMEYDAFIRTVANSGNRLTNSIVIPVWNGRADNFFGYIHPEGDYTLTVSFKKPMSSVTESFSYVIRLDRTKPEYISCEYEMKDNVPTLTVNASDDHGIRSITVIDSTQTTAVQNSDGSFDMTGLIGKYIYIDICDHALNSRVVRIKNPVLPTDGE